MNFCLRKPAEGTLNFLFQRLEKTSGAVQTSSVVLMALSWASEPALFPCFEVLLGGCVGCGWGGGQVLTQHIGCGCLACLAPTKRRSSKKGTRWWNFKYFLSIFTPNLGVSWSNVTWLDHICSDGLKPPTVQMEWLYGQLFGWHSPSTFDERVGRVSEWFLCIAAVS